MLLSDFFRTFLCPERGLTDLYEAFVLWSFYKCMVESFDSEKDLVSRLEEVGTAKVPPPFCCITQRLGLKWLNRMTLGVIQYVFIRVILSLLVLALALAGAGIKSRARQSIRIRPAYQHYSCAPTLPPLRSP